MQCRHNMLCWKSLTFIPSKLKSCRLKEFAKKQEFKNMLSRYSELYNENILHNTWTIYISNIVVDYFAIFIMWQLIINEMSNFIISDAKRHLTCSLILFCKNAAKIRYCIRYVFCIIHVRVFTCLHLWKDVHFRSS